MHVVWKRPDGYHESDPSDFEVVELGGRSRIWLHKTDHDWFPFRISGGWQEQEATKRLNNLVNLLKEDDSAWCDLLLRMYNDTLGDEPEKFFDGIAKWIGDLRSHLKGDTWELDIMNEAVSEIQKRLESCRDEFLRQTHKQQING